MDRKRFLARIRFLPIEYFVTVELIFVLSLIYSPAPFFSTEGYSDGAVILSICLGVVVAVIAFLNGLFRAISLRTHLNLVGGLGIAMILLGVFAMSNQSMPRVFFLIYGISFTVLSQVTRIPTVVLVARKRQRIEETPARRVPTERRAA